MTERGGKGAGDIERIFTDGLSRSSTAGVTTEAAGKGFSAKAHVAVVGTVYALAAHTHKLGFAVLEMRKARFTIDLVPLVRAAYEAALTASWIAQVPDALPAYLNRNHNQQKALRDTIKKAGWASGAQVIPADELNRTWSATYRSMEPTTSTGSAKISPAATVCTAYTGGCPG